MIADKLENIDKYEELKPVAETIKAFIAKVESEYVETGRYELGNENYVMVQRYNTKKFEDAGLESHKLFADVQYVATGIERCYVDNVEGLKAIDDQTPGNDIIFYAKNRDCGYVLLREGMFAYLAPQDAHIPCVTHNESVPMTKVVFKIKL